MAVKGTIFRGAVWNLNSICQKFLNWAGLGRFLAKGNPFGLADAMDALRKELEKKQQYIDALLAQSDTQKEDFSQQLSDMAAERDHLKTELASFQHYKREKMALEIELNRLHENEAILRKKNERELSKLRYQSLEEKVRLKNEEIAIQQRFHQDVEARVCSTPRFHLR